jgi:hypothetical protein
VAGEAIRLRRQVMGRKKNRKCEKTEGGCSVMSSKSEEVG